MKIKKIKTKPLIEYGSGGGSMAIGRKIIIHTDEMQDLSIEQISKIEEFFKTL
jgi:hypothetical protein